ncbi:5-formyltetrahydrofolate cyclo-ligase [Carboxylicivirga sp. N1Y90]|uniref:5-formyltetrahydrofolate cyclo-ligase n=1 Tax=Carboxylicivirga fragile TaxID=3417571 RepID=UPI003D327E20|nr:5-formyltetrahydrofolate cyclo-ligase [Marinilabiliaceae bacterium N1Y90]
MKDKKELRRAIKAIKQLKSKEEKLGQSISICKQLLSNSIYQEAKNILFYWAMADEVETQTFISDQYQLKSIYLPVIRGEDLDMVLFEGEDKLIPGPKYGIPEPSGERLLDESIIDLVIVPGVAFDSENNRMGRGAGYYDRILNRLPNAKKIALAFDFQMVEEVPTEPHDIRMDSVIFYQ